jgi:hypothetical protein
MRGKKRSRIQRQAFTCIDMAMIVKCVSRETPILANRATSPRSSDCFVHVEPYLAQEEKLRDQMNRLTYSFYAALILAGSALLSSCGNSSSSATSAVLPTNTASTSPTPLPSESPLNPRKFWDEKDRDGSGGTTR